MSPAGASTGQRLDRLRDLVRLFEHVPAQRVVRLLGVPGATARTAQSFRERDEPRELGSDRQLAGVDEHRCQVVGFDLAVELGERERHDVFVRQAEALQHRDVVVGRHDLEQGELHVREHEDGVGLRDEHRAAHAGRVDRERPGVHDPNAGERVDPEPRPREIRERDAGHDLDLDVRGAQQQHRLLRDVRAAGHRVDDLAVRVRGVDDERRDRAVHRIEIVAVVVQLVERGERGPLRGEIVDRRVTGRAREADGHARERRERGREHEVRAGRAQPDHDDASAAHPSGATVVDVVDAVGSRCVRGFGGVGATTVYCFLLLSYFHVP